VVSLVPSKLDVGKLARLTAPRNRVGSTANGSSSIVQDRPRQNLSDPKAYPLGFVALDDTKRSINKNYNELFYIAKIH
jgi:hypothetical protein